MKKYIGLVAASALLYQSGSGNAAVSRLPVSGGAANAVSVVYDGCHYTAYNQSGRSVSVHLGSLGRVLGPRQSWQFFNPLSGGPGACMSGIGGAASADYQ